MWRLELEGVQYSYPGTNKPTLDGITSSFTAGEFVVLLGCNGSGKSTLAQVMAGILKPSSGTVAISSDVPSVGKEPPNPHPVGILLQNPDESLFTSSVAHEIAWGLENCAIPNEEIEQRVNKTLKSFGLTELADRPQESLSDGQKQLVALAALVAVEHRFYILDEAAAYLDPFWKRQVRETAHALTKDAGVMWITSRPSDVRDADRIWIMHRGHLAADPIPGEALNQEILARYGLTSASRS